MGRNRVNSFYAVQLSKTSYLNLQCSQNLSCEIDIQKQIVAILEMLEAKQLILDPDLSLLNTSEDEIDLADISSDLLLDPELSPKVGNNPNTINSQNASTDDSEDDAQEAEAAPEPTNVF